MSWIVWQVWQHARCDIKDNFTLLNYLVHTMFILVMDTLTYKQVEK
jgi:hypothetical protein